MLKKISAVVIGFFCLFLWNSARAGPLEDYNEARKLYQFAAACRAAYSDYLGQLAQDALTDNGWQVQKYKQIGSKADARMLLINRADPDTGKTVYILASTGTETVKDMLTDLMIDKLYFAGHTPEEMEANAALKEIPPNQPMVHKGFYNYVKTAFTIEDPNSTGGHSGLLFSSVAANRDSTIYLIGHSLGGAAATLTAAALINFGVQPEQLQVITFGAPAVGNEAFRDQYTDKINLTRYVMRGDKVTGVLQGLGSYVQFGQEVTLRAPDDYHYNSHDMVLYLDHAIKNYYDKRQLAVDAGVLSVPSQALPGASGNPLIYVSPLIANLPPTWDKELPYMKAALQDEYRQLFPAYILADGSGTTNALREAAAAGSQWLVVPEFQARRLKNDPNSYQLTFQQTVYRVKDSQLVSLQTFSCGTQKLTPVEAAIHLAMEMSSEKSPWAVN
mgnify:CR=1 FL=1